MDWSEDKYAYYAFNPKFDDESDDSFCEKKQTMKYCFKEKTLDRSDYLCLTVNPSITLEITKKFDCLFKEKNVIEEIVYLIPHSVKHTDFESLFYLDIAGVSVDKCNFLNIKCEIIFNNKVPKETIKEIPQRLNNLKIDDRDQEIIECLESIVPIWWNLESCVEDCPLTLKNNILRDYFTNSISYSFCCSNDCFYRLLYHENAIRNGAFCYDNYWFRTKKEKDLYKKLKEKTDLKILPNYPININTTDWYELDFLVTDDLGNKGVIELNGSSHNGRSDYDHEKRRKVMDCLNIKCYEIYSNKQSSDKIITDFLLRFFRECLKI